MNKAGKTYLIQFSGAMTLYVIVLSLSATLVQRLGDTPWRIPLALLPMIPVGFGMLAFLRFFRAMDELQKRIQLDALAFGFGTTGLLTFSYGLLQTAGLPEVSFVFVFPLMIALWGFGTIRATMRYQ